MTFFNEQEVRKTIAIMKPNNQVFECRVLYNNKQTYSGYFSDADTLIKAMRSINPKDCNVYFTLNTLKSGCYSRTQRDKFEKNPKTTTAEDVVGYEWLLIDLDPKRVSGTSSTDEELQAAKDVGNKVYLGLKNLGFENPIFAFSGNGVHLLYKIHIANTEETRALIKKCLEVIHFMFTTDDVDPDLKVHDPNRITKLYGFLSQKGSNTEDRPHRISYIIGGADKYENIKTTDIGYLRKLAGLISDEPEVPQNYNSYNPGSFDVEAWFQKYNIDYTPVSYKNGGTKYILDHCPFDENHNGKDAVVFKRPNGALSFLCLHSSCADKHWREFRQFYEPNAYERREAIRTERMYHSYNRHIKPPVRVTEKLVEGSPVFYTAQNILDMNFPEMTFVKTGINIIDKKMRGLGKGQISVWSGLRASGKSSVVSEIGLNAVEDGNNVAYFSGELFCKDFMDWMNLQAAGKSYVTETNNEGFYTTPHEIRKRIAKWLEGHFWLYNNDYGNNFREVIGRFEEIIDKNKLDLLILDNLMALDISDLSDTKWDAQKEFVLALKSVAQSHKIHLAFIAHPRKAMGFLRFDDIAGTADLGNAVDSAFIVHRVNRDFKRYTGEMFGWHEDNEIYEATNVIEIVKDRHSGQQDVFIPLYYEIESKRLKNEKSENVIYGWCNDEPPKEPMLSLSDLTDYEADTDDNPFE